MVSEVSSERRCGPSKRERTEWVMGYLGIEQEQKSTGYVLYILSQVCRLLLKSKLKYFLAEIVFFVHDPP